MDTNTYPKAGKQLSSLVFSFQMDSVGIFIPSSWIPWLWNEKKLCEVNSLEFHKEGFLEARRHI